MVIFIKLIIISFNMPYYIQKYHIKSILNLRGKSKRDWYLYEINFAKKHNIKHYNFAIGSGTVYDVKTMNKILNIIKLAPKPIVVHCAGGADRSGLVTALYLYKIKHLSAKKAKEALSIEYLHAPWLFRKKTKAMDKSFDKYIKEYK